MSKLVGWNHFTIHRLFLTRSLPSGNVPTKWSKNSKLGRWVSDQRAQRKAGGKSKRSSLTPEREQRLTELGFVWTNAVGVLWYETKHESHGPTQSDAPLATEQSESPSDNPLPASTQSCIDGPSKYPPEADSKHRSSISCNEGKTMPATSESMKNDCKDERGVKVKVPRPAVDNSAPVPSCHDPPASSAPPEAYSKPPPLVCNEGKTSPTTTESTQNTCKGKNGAQIRALQPVVDKPRPVPKSDSHFKPRPFSRKEIDASPPTIGMTEKDRKSENIATMLLPRPVVDRARQLPSRHIPPGRPSLAPSKAGLKPTPFIHQGEKTASPSTDLMNSVCEEENEAKARKPDVDNAGPLTSHHNPTDMPMKDPAEAPREPTKSN